MSVWFSHLFPDTKRVCNFTDGLPVSERERETVCAPVPVRTCNTHTVDEKLQIIIGLIAHLTATKVFNIRGPLYFLLAGIYNLTFHLNILTGANLSFIHWQNSFFLF